MTAKTKEMAEVTQHLEALAAPDPTSPGGWLEVAERFADKPDALERVFAIYEREEERRERKAYNTAMVRVQSMAPAVKRDAYNEQTRSRYAKLERIVKVLSPIYTDAGFSISGGMEDSPLADHIRVVIDVMHAEGHSRQYRGDFGIDIAGIKGTANKTRVHAIGSTFSYGRRYLTAAAFNVVLSDEDDDGIAAGAGEPITAQQAADLAALVEEVGADLPKFLRWGGVSDLADLPAAKLAQAVTLLEQKR